MGRINTWTLTEEHRKQIPAWNERWIQTIMSTEAMTEDDRAIVRRAINGMYDAAKLARPKAIVFVRGPIEGAIVAGAAAAWWHAKKNGMPVARDTDGLSAFEATCNKVWTSTNKATATKTDEATTPTPDSFGVFDATAKTAEVLTSAVTMATNDAVHHATIDGAAYATQNATASQAEKASGMSSWQGLRTIHAVEGVTRSATDAASDNATEEAVKAAVSAVVRGRTEYAARGYALFASQQHGPCDDATMNATGSDVARVTNDAVPADSIKGIVDAALQVVGDTDFARQCIAAATNMRNGGNEWASWCCYLSFVRDVVGFTDESHAAYKHYEDCAIHSGWRYMHSEFVIVCDRPLRRVTRMVGDRYQLHCEDGPAIEWRDSNVAWYIEGVRVDRQIVMAPETQTVAQIDAEQNADVKEIRIRRYGWPRYLQESGARVVDSRICEVTNTTEALMETKDGTRRLMVTCPTRRRFAPGVPREIKTCEEAQRWLAGPFGQARVVART